jgi:hypothetical protein
VTSKGKVVASTFAEGLGRAVTLSFDPEATPTPQVAQVLLAAVRYAASGPQPGIVTSAPQRLLFDATLQSGGPLELRLQAIVPPALRVTSVDGGVATAPVVWRFSLAEGEDARRRMTVVPDLPGTWRIDATLSEQQTGAILANASLDLSVLGSRQELLAAAVAAVAALPPGGIQAHALAELSAIDSRHGGRDASESAICHLLAAIESVKKLNEATAARLALDALLRELELTSAATP